MNRHMKTLELDKMLERLAGLTNCSDAADLAKNILPAKNLSEAQGLLDETLRAYEMMARLGSPAFGGLKSVNAALSRARSGGTLFMGDLLGVAQVLHVIRTVCDWGFGLDMAKTGSLSGYFSSLSPNKYLEDKIRGAILSEDEMSDNASPALRDIRRRMNRARDKVRSTLDGMIRSASYQKHLQDLIVTQRDGRMVIPVKSESRGAIPGLVHDTSSSGATLFVEPMPVVELNNDIKVMESKERDEIERILEAFSAEVGEFADSIEQSYDAMVKLNVIFAKARLAFDMKASAPRLNSGERISLAKARHPLLDPKKVVPVDITLGGPVDTLVITGPNTGGKTVALKTLGLLTLMAMCGLMIPASEESHIAVFRAVLADIGDEQSIEQSLSTFSSHMVNIVEILDTAGADTLVLLDELGAGTDPVEGAALAMSILESLRRKGAKIAATTHYAELKSYALDKDGVENASCEFDVVTLRPTYRLLIGVPGRSNAFAISGRLGLPKDIIDEARGYISSDNTRFEKVVRSLEKARQEAEEERKEVARLKSELEEASKSAGQRLRETGAERDKILEAAKAEARRLVDKTRADSSALLDELEDLRKKSRADASEKAKQARAAFKSGMRGLEQTADPVEVRRQEDYRLPRPLKQGDRVRIVDIDKEGTVMAPTDSSGSTLVLAGIIKTRIPEGNLRLLEEKSGGKTSGKRNISRSVSSAAAPAALEIDLRGEAADEAIMDLDRFIDTALRQNMEQITIIHGKGTGVLRTAVHQHLRQHPMVKEFRLGTFGEGESGVTIAQLK